MQHPQSSHVHLGPRHDNSTSACCSTPAPPSASTLQKQQHCVTAEEQSERHPPSGRLCHPSAEAFAHDGALQTAGVGLPYCSFPASGGHCQYLLREHSLSLRRDHRLLIFYYFSINSICFFYKASITSCVLVLYSISSAIFSSFCIIIS